MIKTIAVERWSKPDENRRVKPLGMMKAQEAFDRLERYLSDRNLLPDEYFLFSEGNFPEKGELPVYTSAACTVNFGGSEGIYMDIVLKGERDVHFATGKTLGESAEDFRRMSAIAGECSMLLNGNGMTIRELSDEKVFLKALEVNIKPLGFELKPSGTGEKSDLIIAYHKTPVGHIERPSNDLYLKNGVLPERLNAQLRDICYKTMEAATLYEGSPVLSAVKGGGYRRLCDYGDAVLAAMYREGYGFEFVTWNYSYDGKQVDGGNYFGTNYEAAKQDFVRRSGLMPGSKLFSEEELLTMTRAIESAMQSDYGANLPYNEMKTLSQINQRLGDALPPVTEPLMEAAQAARRPPVQL